MLCWKFQILVCFLFFFFLAEASLEYRIYSSRRRIDSKHNLSYSDRYDIFNCAFEFGQTWWRFTSRPTLNITRQMILRKEKRREKESKKSVWEGTTNKSKGKCFQLSCILFLCLQTLTNTLTNVDIISFISFCLHSIQRLLSLWNRRDEGKNNWKWKGRGERKTREKHEEMWEENEWVNKKRTHWDQKD